MKQFTYTVNDPQGIHARPAGLLVKAAAAFQSDIKITKADKEADLKRIIAVMSLGVKKDDTVTVSVDGADEADASAAIEQFFKDNL